MRALTALFIVERILIVAFVGLLGAKFAVYCDLLDKDFSWYYVLMPILGIILLMIHFYFLLNFDYFKSFMKKQYD